MTISDIYIVIGIFVAKNMILIIIQLLNPFKEEEPEITTIYDKCTESSAEYFYLIFCEFDPRKKQRFHPNSAVIIIGLKDIKGQHITRFTITPELLKNWLLIDPKKNLVKTRLATMGPMPAIHTITLNENLLEKELFIYSIEIRDCRLKRAYSAEVNQGIKSQPPSVSSLQLQTYSCQTKNNVTINQKIVAQHILYSELVYFVYLSLNLVFITSVILSLIWSQTVVWLHLKYCVTYIKFMSSTYISIRHKSQIFN